MAQQQGAAKKNSGISFGSLMPYLETLVGPDQKIQLHNLYIKFKKDEISREGFVRGARFIAGEKLILEALSKMNSKVPVQPKEEQGEPAHRNDQPQAQYQQQQPQAQYQQQQPQTQYQQQQPQYQQHQQPQQVQIQLPMKNIRSYEVPGLPASKKQKVDSLDQINDVTAVGGVNLKEEEERLLTAPREESRTTAEMRRKFLEEDGRFLCQKVPLHAKVQEIVAKAGLKNISEDVERCLSMGLEEILWNQVLKSVNISKQRSDVEKDRHRVMGTLDYSKLINKLKKEQYEFQQRKRAEEAERQRKLEEEKAAANEDGKEAPKSQKTQQQDETTRTKAANQAARKAIGVDDVALKWLLMAQQREQQQKQTTSDAWGTQRFQEQGAAAKSFGSGTPRPSARRSVLPQPRPARSVTLKDLITCLERDPLMCRSPILYKLYDKVRNTEASL